MIETLKDVFLEKGIEQGLEKGIKKGRKEGREEERKEFLTKMIKSGILTIDKAIGFGYQEVKKAVKKVRAKAQIAACSKT